MTYTRIDPNNIPPDTRFWNFNIYSEVQGSSVSGVFCATPAELDAIEGKKLYFPTFVGAYGPYGYGSHGIVRGVFHKSMCISLTTDVNYIKMHLENDYTINSPLEHVVDEWPEETPTVA